VGKGEAVKEKIKPCPFCGNEKPRCYESGGYWHIRCQQCECEIYASPYRSGLIERWNQRAVAHEAMIEREQLRKDLRRCQSTCAAAARYLEAMNFGGGNEAMREFMQLLMALRHCAEVREISQ